MSDISTNFEMYIVNRLFLSLTQHGGKTTYEKTKKKKKRIQTT